MKIINNNLNEESTGLNADADWKTVKKHIKKYYEKKKLNRSHSSNQLMNTNDNNNII